MRAAQVARTAAAAGVSARLATCTSKTTSCSCFSLRGATFWLVALHGGSKTKQKPAVAALNHGRGMGGKKTNQTFHVI